MNEPCQACQSEISTDAFRCPECGYEPRDKGSGVTTAFLALTVLFVAVGFVFGYGILSLIVGGVAYLFISNSSSNRKRRKPTTYSP